MTLVSWLLLFAVLGLGIGLWMLMSTVSRMREELRRSGESATAAEREAAARLESKVETLTQQLGSRITETGNTSLRLSEMVKAELQSTSKALAESLQNTSRALSESVQTTNRTVSEQLQHTHKSLSELQERLGRLDEATRQVEQVGKSISGLEQILASPKLRGGLGEWTLEMLLGEVLPGDAVLRQHRLDTRGVVVDFAVRAADDRIIPIDSKFPMESFRRFHAADVENSDDADKLRRELERSVRARVDEIATKYISPDDGTLDYALMYLPSEAVYYELAVRTDGSKFLDYARGRNVIPCSPNTLYAYLQAIALGLRGLQIAQQARWIQGALRHLEQDAGRAREAFTKAQNQLKYASNNMDGVGSALTSIEERLEGLTVERVAERAALPPAEGESAGAAGPAASPDLFEQTA